MSNDARTIREAGVGAEVVTQRGKTVTIMERLSDGWYRCETTGGKRTDLHGTCRIMARN